MKTENKEPASPEQKIMSVGGLLFFGGLALSHLLPDDAAQTCYNTLMALGIWLLLFSGLMELLNWAEK